MRLGENGSDKSRTAGRDEQEIAPKSQKDRVEDSHGVKYWFHD